MLTTGHKTYLFQSPLSYTKYPVFNKNHEVNKKATRNNILPKDKAFNTTIFRYDTDIGTT